MDPATLELVNSARAGDRASFAALVERFRGTVFALAYSYLRDADEAEDVSQEVFVRAYLAMGRLQEPGRFPSWLNGITAHAAVDRLRDRQTSPSGGGAGNPWLENSPQTPQRGPRESAEGGERKDLLNAAIEKALGELSEDCRRAALLRFFSDMSYMEIAEVTSVPVSTVRGQLYRATRHMRDRLRRFWKEPGVGV
jgi:RNA polymerase sigma-70 factor (ECF subfamily)